MGAAVVTPWLRVCSDEVVPGLKAQQPDTEFSRSSDPLGTAVIAQAPLRIPLTQACLIGGTWAMGLHPSCKEVWELSFCS